MKIQGSVVDHVAAALVELLQINHLTAVVLEGSAGFVLHYHAAL